MGQVSIIHRVYRTYRTYIEKHVELKAFFDSTIATVYRYGNYERKQQ